MIEDALAVGGLVVGQAGIRVNGAVTGAAAGAGTLTNAPAAGDPQFWLPVMIGAVQYWIPAWHL